MDNDNCRSKFREETDIAEHRRPLGTYTLRQLAYFIGAVEEGSTAAAAARFYISQSSMSAALSDLESALGTQLLVRRRGRGVELTSVGRELLTDARQLVRSAEEFGMRAGALQEGLHGGVVLGCYRTISPFVLPHLLDAVRRAHQGIEVTVLEGTQAELLGALRDGRAELAVLYDVERGSEVTACELYRPEVQVLLHRGHDLASRQEVFLKELEDLPYLMLDVPPARELTLRAFEESRVVPNVRHTSANFDSLRALVHHGLGYTIVSHRGGALPDHWGDGVVAVRVAGVTNRDSVVLAANVHTRLTQRARLVRDVAVETFRGRG